MDWLRILFIPEFLFATILSAIGTVFMYLFFPEYFTIVLLAYIVYKALYRLKEKY